MTDILGQAEEGILSFITFPGLVYIRYVYPRLKKATFTNHENSSSLQVGFSQKNVKYVGKFYYLYPSPNEENIII